MKKCPYCAEEIQSEAIKCRYCGERFDTKPATNGGHGQLKRDTGEKNIRPTVPDIEGPLTIMQKASVSTYFAGDRPKHYDWLDGTVDLVLSPNAIVVVASAPVTRFKKAADVVAGIGMVGLFTGLLVSIPAGLLGVAHENFFGKKNKFDKAALQTLADSGNAIWIETSAAHFYFIDVKGGIFFGDPGCLYAVTGPFETATGKLSMCLSMSDGRYAPASDIRKLFEKPGYSFRRSIVKKDQDKWINMEKMFLESISDLPPKSGPVFKLGFWHHGSNW